MVRIHSPRPFNPLHSDDSRKSSCSADAPSNRPRTLRAPPGSGFVCDEITERLHAEDRPALQIAAHTCSCGEMDGHCAGVVRHKNPPLGCCQSEHFRVKEPFEVSIVRALEVDRWFTAADAANDGAIQISVRKKADAHDPDFRNSSLAR